MLTVKKNGCGFVDAVLFGDRQVVRARRGFIGASVSLAPAGDGSAESLFGNKVARRLPARIGRLEQAGASFAVEGEYTDGKVSAPFSRKIEVDADEDVVTVTETADFTGLADRYLVAEHKLELPLVVDDDPHLRMLAFGGEHRVEMFRMDMNDVSRRGVNISDTRGYWPYWDIGGVLQLPGSYRVWKANHADTMAYPIEQGDGAPGWADYSELDWGVTARVAGAKAAAPWAIKIDARKGLFTFEAHPSSQPAVAGEDYGKRRIAFTLTLHRTSWPVEFPCELDTGLYERLLTDLMSRERDSLVYSLGTDDPHMIVHRERVQPSIALRALYARDGGPMQRLLKRIGTDAPADQPLSKWDKDAAAFLDWVRANGVPG